MAISIQELAARVGAEVDADVELEITGVAAIDCAGPTELTFLGNELYAPLLKESKAGAVLIPPTFDCPTSMATLRTSNPRLALAKVLALFHPARRPPAGIHPTAVVPDSCRLGTNVHVGAYVVLGEGVEVGDDVVIHPHCCIYDGASIGPGSVLHSHAVVREDVTLGARSALQNGAIVGADGFGFAIDADGRHTAVPQTGSVEVGDDVDIQANACIDRAALGATLIGRGTKIDNLVQVGHGSTIGEDCILCGQVALAGSTHLGNRVVLGGQAGLAGHLRVGDNANVAAQSGVVGDLEANQSYGGSPAVELALAKRAALGQLRLPDLYKRVKRLERAVRTLEDGD